MTYKVHIIAYNYLITSKNIDQLIRKRGIFLRVIIQVIRWALANNNQRVIQTDQS